MDDGRWEPECVDFAKPAIYVFHPCRPILLHVVNRYTNAFPEKTAFVSQEKPVRLLRNALAVVEKGQGNKQAQLFRKKLITLTSFDCRSQFVNVQRHIVGGKRNAVIFFNPEHRRKPWPSLGCCKDEIPCRCAVASKRTGPAKKMRRVDEGRGVWFTPLRDSGYLFVEYDLLEKVGYP